MESPLVIFTRGFLGLCPHCGKQRMFRGVYALHQRCPHCALQFEDRPGDFTGAASINTLATGSVAVAAALGGVLVTKLSALALTALATPLLVVVATLFHQPIKGLWIALMYYTEAISPPSG